MFFTIYVSFDKIIVSPLGSSNAYKCLRDSGEFLSQTGNMALPFCRQCTCVKEHLNRMYKCLQIRDTKENRILTFLLFTLLKF